MGITVDWPLKTAGGLAKAVQECTRCPLSAKQEPNTLHVPAEVGKDYHKHGIGIICEAPGYYEAKSGRPLVGKAGQLFDQLVAQAGLSRDQLMLTNVVRCRPPDNNLKDYPEATFACDHWTQLELSVYDPALIILMGATAMSKAFGADAKVGATRGTFTIWNGRVAAATYHPSAAVYGGGLTSETANYIIRDIRMAKRVWESLG